MKILYAENPLETVVELDDNDREVLRLKLVIDGLQDRIAGASVHLEEDGKWFDLAAARKEISGDDLYDSVESRAVEMLGICEEHLKGSHGGDCTCVPCSCMKCYAEGLLGIDTIPGLGKHAGHQIYGAFAAGRTLPEVLASLADYKPVRTGGWLLHPEEDFNQHIPRWAEQAKRAHAWLERYRAEHLTVALA